VVDLFVADDDEGVVAELLGAATALARELGCHVLEVIGLPASLRAVAAGSRPLERRFPVHPWLFRAVDDELGETLSEPSVWYPTLFDGDSSLPPL
jgi:hypothetical protein